MMQSEINCIKIRQIPTFQNLEKETILRTVPTIVIAHTFCASRDARIPYGWCLLIQRYFCVVQNLASALCIQKKLGVTMHFSEKKECHTLLCIFKLFSSIID